MDKQPDIRPPFFHRLARHWWKIVCTFLYFGFVLLSVKIYHQIEQDGSGNWPEGSLCTDQMFLQIRPGMSHADVFRHFPVVEGYRIKRTLNEYLRASVESGDAEGIVTRVLEGGLDLEEWIVQKEGAGEHADIFFNAEERVAGTDCGNC